MPSSTHTCLLRSLALLGLLPALGALGGGCVGEPPTGAPESVSNESDDILASNAIARAEEWVKVKLHYCQSPNHAPDGDAACSSVCNRYDDPAWNPYRSDCSGLVSWAWGLPAPGRVTWELAPFQSDISHTIPASSLQPGDAVNSQPHIMLFKEWVVPGKRATFIEEPGCSSATPYAHELTSDVSINGSDIYVAEHGATFVAIRYDAIQEGPPPPPPQKPRMFDSGSGVGQNHDGRLEVFALGADEAVYHAWQKTGGGWEGWSSLGGASTSDPVVATNGDGRLEVFVAGKDHAIYHRWQTSPGGAWSSGWSSLGGDAAGKPAVAVNRDGRLEVFAAGPDGALHHVWQLEPNGKWGGWSSLGGHVTGSPAAGMNDNGTLEVFTRAPDGSVHHIWQTAPNGGWSSWSSLGGAITGDPTAGRNADGRLEIYGRGLDGAAWHDWQKQGGGWSGWSKLGGDIVGDVAVATNQDGRLEVFIRGTGGAAWHTWQKTPNGAWSGWSKLGGALTGDLFVGANKDGRLEAFAPGAGDTVDHAWQTTPNGSWSGFIELAGEAVP